MPAGAAAEPPPGASDKARFGRQSRLLKHADFDRVYKNGQRHFGTHLTVFFMKQGGTGIRVGFTVGRNLGGAVQRNRIKRRLREAVRLHLRELASPVDVVLNPKRSALTTDFSEIEREISRAFLTISRKVRPHEKESAE